MDVPKTEGTKRLKPFKRQFFQWHYIDSYTLPTVEELFHRLFLYLLMYGDGIPRHATNNQWRGRRLEWRKGWNIPGRERGPSLPTPPDLLGFQLWFEGIEYAQGFQPFVTIDGEAPNPFKIPEYSLSEPPIEVLDDSTSAKQHVWNTKVPHRTYSELSPVSQSFGSPTHLGEPLFDTSPYVNQAPGPSSTCEWSLDSRPQDIYQESFPPALSNACTTFDEYGSFLPDSWDTTTTIESSSYLQSHPPNLLPMTSPSLHVPVEPAVASFYGNIPHRSNGSRIQSQGNDIDPSINALILPDSYDPRPGQLSYDELLPHNRPDN